MNFIGGVLAGNAQQAINVLGDTDSKVIGGSFHNNGAGSFYAVHVRGLRSAASSVMKPSLER